MDIATEISTLRKWLREDETLLPSVPVEPNGDVAYEKRDCTTNDFDQWVNFSNWNNA